MYLAVTILAVIIVISAWKVFIRSHSIEQVQGPLALPLIGNGYLVINKSMDDLLDLIHNYSMKYWPLMRLWRGVSPIIAPFDPSDLEVVLSNSTYIRKNFDYETIIARWLGDGLLISHGSKWHKRRKMLTPAFHFTILEQFIPIFSSKVKILVKILGDYVCKSEGVDITPLIARCALDVICETAMGTNVRAQEDKDSQYVKEIYEINELLVYRIISPWLHNDFIYSISPSGRRAKKLITSLHNFTDNVIKQRREELKKKLKNKVHINEDENGSRKKIAFLDLLLTASENDPSLTDSDIREEVDTFMFEGHDTTAMAMSWACYFLGTHTGVQEKCVEELKEIFGDSNRDSTYNDLAAMKYLERVIKETLRLRPSVAFFARYLEKSIQLGGKEFSAGTSVYLNVYSIHRNPKIFPDPEKFDPDRFTLENSIGRHPYCYIPFSAGPRNCIGQKFAMLEMKNLLSTILRHFRLESINPQHYYRAAPDLILRPKFGLQMRIHKR